MATMHWLERAVPQSKDLHPYVPGKPIETLQREKGLQHVIKLASNENPYGVPPKAVQAMQNAATQVYLYPDGDAMRLKQALAAYHGCAVQHILPGNGSNEVLELLIRSFAGHGDKVVYSQRAFIVYALATMAAGATGIAVPDTDALGHDLDAMLAAIDEHTKVVCIANPNNPTGTLLSNAQIQAFLNQVPEQVVVILDEAYTEFVADMIGDSVAVLSHPGLVITRTFSKAYGLAGCRVGYAIADADLIAVVNRFREPFNVNLVAQAAAIAALDDQDWVRDNVSRVLASREGLEDTFKQLGVLGGHSDGNFVLLKHDHALELVKLLEDKGIIVRPLAGYGMPDYLRISVGTDEENQHFIAVLSELLQDDFAS